MSNSQEQRRVQEEQDYVKEKGHGIVDKVKDIRAGGVHIDDLPSNDRLAAKIDHGEASLERFQDSARGQQMGEAGQKVVEDIKQVMHDEKVFLKEKNAGDLLQTTLLHFWSLLQELKADPKLRDTFEEWQGNLTSLLSSGDVNQFLSQARDLFTSMKDTEEFLELLSQLIDVLKSAINEKTEQVTEGETFDAELYKKEKEQDRHRVLTQVKATLVSLSENDMWKRFVEKGKVVGRESKAAGDVSKISTKEVAYRVQESPKFTQLMEDFRCILQRLAGEERNVDALFEYSKGAAHDIINNDELAYLVGELRFLLEQIVEDPALLDDDITQERLKNLVGRSERTLEEFANNPNIKGAKEESRRVLDSIKSDPANAQFLRDLKTLWHDVVSDKDGKLVDGDVMTSIRQMVVPLFLEHLNNVPLPAVHDTANFLGKLDYSIDNMKISLPELIPDNIHMRFEMDLDAHPMELTAETKHTYLYLQASNIHAHVHDANWTYARRTIPKMHDSGIFDVDTTGDGITIYMKMEVKGDTEKGAYLNVIKSNVKINQKFHIAFNDSRHDKLYEMLTHVFANKIKKSIVEMLQEKLKLFGNYFSDQLLALIEQARISTEMFAKVAKETAGQAKGTIDKAKTQAKGAMGDYTNNPNLEESKQEAKSTAKGLLNAVSDKVQGKLDEQKHKIEEKKKDAELDRMMKESEKLDINSKDFTLYDSHTTAIDSTQVVYPPSTTTTTQSTIPSTQSL